MSDNRQDVYRVKNPNVDLDLANFNHFVSPESEAGHSFDVFMQQMAHKLIDNSYSGARSLKEYQVCFYLQDREDDSPARISSIEDRMNSADLSGNDFVVMFNRDKLQQLQSEDELAFILAHELSHLGWQHGDSEIRGLHGNEEAACDINALKMMDAAGYNVRVVENMDRHVPSSPEWQQRKEARRQTMMYMFSREMPKPLDTSLWESGRHVRWMHDFQVPGIDTPEAEAISMMSDNLRKVSEKGGREECVEMIGNYVRELGSAQGGKFFLRLSAALTTEFPPIDEVKRTEGYRALLRHPFNVAANAIPQVEALPGNKFYPPEACCRISGYLKENPDYHRIMKRYWDKVLLSGNQLAAGRGERQ